MHLPTGVFLHLEDHRICSDCLQICFANKPTLLNLSYTEIVQYCPNEDPSVGHLSLFKLKIQRCHFPAPLYDSLDNKPALIYQEGELYLRACVKGA